MGDPKQDGKKQKNQRKCFGISQAYHLSQQKRAERREQPQPWILLKLMVAVVLLILGYTYYVYVVRLCIPMVRRESNAKGKRAQGIAYIVVFNVLILMSFWSYVKVVLTPPGYAQDYVQKSTPPQPRSLPDVPMSSSSESYVPTQGGPPYLPTHPPTPSARSLSVVESSQTPTHSGTAREMDVEKAVSNTGDTTCPVGPIPNAEQLSPSPVDTAESAAQAYARDYTIRLGLTASRGSAVTRPALNETMEGLPVTEINAVTTYDVVQSEQTSRRNLPPLSRQPLSYPALLPQYRYCRRCEFVKPVRTHHCRICGKCVLMFDHHCPWIGQCVGARNRRFFLIFNLWGSICSLWVCITLITAEASYRAHVDPQLIVVTALAGFFAFFTTSLGSSHIGLVMFNLTTVEKLSVSRMKEQEHAVLSSNFEFYEIGKKREMRRRWDEEWGRIGMEGNLWWRGSFRRNWESMMGGSVWYWLLPVGRSMSDGLNFPINPRFSSDGRWRRRVEWPADVM